MKAMAINSMRNLLINSVPTDGPMVKDILNVMLIGCDNIDVKLDEYDAEKLEELREVCKKLNRGEYNILPL